MPDLNGSDQDPKEYRQFIKEKIVRQPLTRGQIARRGLLFFCTAVGFGAIATVTSVLTKPYIERQFGVEPTRESVPITIPQDEPDVPAEPETSAQETPAETEPIEDILQSAMEKYEFSVDDLNVMYANMRSICSEADQGIVTVHSVQQETDWFDNTVENTGLYSGAVIASTGTELLVLTSDSAVESADSIKVTFSDGVEADGTKKQADAVMGMAVVSVPVTGLDVETLEHVKVINLGNSYAVKQGDIVMSVGAPAGMVHSTDYGFVSYITKNVQIPDGTSRVFYSDVKSNQTAGTFMINTSGEIIGWGTDAYRNESCDNMTAIMAISDYKSTIEKLTNGMAAPYLGIRGQEVNSQMKESGLPEGLYIIESIADGPAYNAGIQSGDIITSIGSKEVKSIKEFRSQLDSLAVGSVVTVVVQRPGREEFKEIEYQVTIGAR